MNQQVGGGHLWAGSPDPVAFFSVLDAVGIPTALDLSVLRRRGDRQDNPTRLHQGDRWL
jgi:hypothetical protein